MQGNDLDRLIGALDEQIAGMEAARAAPKQNTSALGDFGTALKQGVQRVPGAITGLLDVPVALATGQPLVSKGWEEIGKLTGFQPGKWADQADSEYSDAHQQFRREGQAAQDEGFVSALGHYLSNPLQSAISVTESLPAVAAGGVLGRAKALAGLSGAVRAGVGEGAIMAGQQMQQLTDQGADPRAAAVASALTGVGGGVIGTVGGRIAAKYGLGDVDIAAAGGTRGAGLSIRGVLGGAVSEGFIEEAPQSALEQLMANVALGNPALDGVAGAAGAGAVLGGMMGGAFNLLPGQRPPTPPADTRPPGTQDDLFGGGGQLPQEPQWVEGPDGKLVPYTDLAYRPVADAAAPKNRRQMGLDFNTGRAAGTDMLRAGFQGDLFSQPPVTDENFNPFQDPRPAAPVTPRDYPLPRNVGDALAVVNLVQQGAQRGQQITEDMPAWKAFQRATELLTAAGVKAPQAPAPTAKPAAQPAAQAAPAAPVDPVLETLRTSSAAAQMFKKDGALRGGQRGAQFLYEELGKMSDQEVAAAYPEMVQKKERQWRLDMVKAVAASRGITLEEPGAQTTQAQQSTPVQEVRTPASERPVVFDNRPDFTDWALQQVGASAEDAEAYKRYFQIGEFAGSEPASFTALQEVYAASDKIPSDKTINRRINALRAKVQGLEADHLAEADLATPVEQDAAPGPTIAEEASPVTEVKREEDSFGTPPVAEAAIDTNNDQVTASNAAVAAGRETARIRDAWASRAAQDENAFAWEALPKEVQEQWSDAMTTDDATSADGVSAKARFDQLFQALNTGVQEMKAAPQKDEQAARARRLAAPETLGRDNERLNNALEGVLGGDPDTRADSAVEALELLSGENGVALMRRMRDSLGLPSSVQTPKDVVEYVMGRAPAASQAAPAVKEASSPEEFWAQNVEDVPFESLGPKQQARVGKIMDMVAEDPERAQLEIETLAGRRRSGVEYSEGGQTTGTQAAGVESTLRKLFFSPAKFSRAVTIVQSVDDLPADVRGAASQAQGTVQGFYDPSAKRVYLVADNIAEGSELAVFLHEVGVHMGMSSILGAQNMQRLKSQVEKWSAAQGDAVEHRLARRAASRAAASSSTDTSDELIAYFVEEAVLSGINPTAVEKQSAGLTKWFRTLWAAFRTALRNVGVYRTEKLTAQNVVDLAYGAARLEVNGTYHGTAARFRQFNHNYMGSGEGAQAYGWGTYLAQRPGIAKDYYEADVRRKRGDYEFVMNDGTPVTDRTLLRALHTMTMYGDDVSEYKLRSLLENWQVTHSRMAGRADMQRDTEKLGYSITELQDVIQAGGAYRQTPPDGSLMRVDVAIGEDEMLDWNLPMEEQSEKVKAALERRLDEGYEADDDLPAYEGGNPQYKVGPRTYVTFGEDATGKQLYDYASTIHGSDKAASEYLDSIGIKGIKFLDQPSRRKDGADRTRNIVVFNDKNIHRVATHRGARRDDIGYSEGKTPNRQRLEALYGGEDGAARLLEQAQRFFGSLDQQGERNIYTPESPIAQRLKQASDRYARVFSDLFFGRDPDAQDLTRLGISKASFDFDGDATILRSPKQLGQFTGYVAQITPNPDTGTINMQIYPQEQIDEAGRVAEQYGVARSEILDEMQSSLALQLKTGGELLIYGPKPDSMWFRKLQREGKASFATGRDGEVARHDDGSGWTKLNGVTTAQLQPLFAQLHGYVRASTGADAVGIKWSRGTGATGAFDKEGNAAGRSGAIYFSEAPATQQIVDRAPPQVREALSTAITTVKEGFSKAGNLLMFTEDLVRKAQPLLPSVKPWWDALARREQKSVSLKAKIDAIGERVDALERPAFEKMWSLAKDMTLKGAWAYQPAWAKKDVAVDPEMARRYEELRQQSPEAADLLHDIFQHGHETRATTTKILNDTLAQEKADALDAAKTPKARKKVEERFKKLEKFFAAELSLPQGPYTSMRRVGSHIVVGRSKRYMDALAADDTDALLEMRTDPAHYWMEFTDSMAQAEARARDIQAKFQGGDVRAAVKMREGTDQELPFEAFAKLRQAILKDGGEEAAQSGATVKKLAALVTELYLTSLAETSSRKSELRREGIAGGMDADAMYKAFLSKGSADAHYIGTLANGREVANAFAKMRLEARKWGDQTHERRKVFNELSARWDRSLEYQDGTMVGRLLNVGSVWMLLTKPAYFAYNMSQPFMLSLPAMTQHHGWNESRKAMFDTYAQMFKDKQFFNMRHIDIEKLPEDVRPMLRELRDRGRIDITLTQDLGDRIHGSRTKAGKAAQKVERWLKTTAQKVEMTNRVVTAVAAYRLAKQKGWSDEASIDYADKLIYDTHGSYANLNAPTLMNKTAARRLMTQFRKFQFIQVAQLVRMTKEAMSGTTPAEKWALSRALRFTLAHHAVLAGAMGLPAIQVVAFAMALLGDDDEPKDLEHTLRQAIGDKFTADLLLRGVPAALLDTNMSNNIGMGQAFSIFPFADAELGQRGGYEKLVTAATGPLIGGVGLQIHDGLAAMKDGDFYKGLFNTLPSGLRSAFKALYEHNQGVTNSRGDQLIPPEDITFMMTAAKMMGFRTNTDAIRQLNRGVQHDFEAHFADLSREMRLEYSRAYSENDPQVMAEVRERWRHVQEIRREMGFKAQPLSNLLKAPQEQRKRERDTRGGVQFDNASRDFVAGLF